MRQGSSDKTLQTELPTFVYHELLKYFKTTLDFYFLIRVKRLQIQIGWRT